MEIILDIHGGDNSPEELAKGVISALERHSDLKVTVAGDEIFLNTVFHEYVERGRVNVLTASGIITNDTNPMDAVRDADCTMHKAFSYYEKSDAVGLLTVGSTAAALISSIYILGLSSGMKKPVLCSLLPKKDGGRVALLDCGANLNVTGDDLALFAHIGSAYMQATGRAKNPSVCLMNVGKEENKGTDTVRNADKLLRASELNYVGFAEPCDLFSCDVCVCDGFTGNVLLKNTEETAMSIIRDMRVFAKDAPENKKMLEFIDRQYARFAYNDLGCAVILGTKKPVYKAHGAANALTLQNAIEQILGG
ncbi:MAG: hypothetical protein IJO93_06250 [Clostridia bacterium]|nr:hypothetical protein [Clostridia bacterium]